MTLTELKKNLRKFARAHKGDRTAYEQAKRQISNATSSVEEYQAMVKFYVQEADL